jgi:hypothetical protein
MARTPEQDAARKKLLETGRYEEYINDIGQADVRLKGASQTASTSQNTQPQINNAAITALDNVSPQRQKTNQLVDSLLGSYNTQFNPSTDTSFQAAKSEIENQGDRAYKNVMSGYLGNQSGNFNSAALQIAAGAQNDILKQVPLLQGEYEDRFNANRRQNISDTANMVNLLLGLEDRDIAAKDKALQKQIDTIGQYYNDYQAEINRRTGTVDKSDDELIPYLKIARAEKIANMDNAKLSAQEKATKQAFDMWKVLGYATPEVAALLGIPVNAKTADYADMLADNARSDKQLSFSMSKSKDKSKESNTSGTDFGIALQTMLRSGNPMQWLEDNADVLTQDELKELYAYAKNAGLDKEDLFKSASTENKNAYDNIRKTFLNAVNYKDNPQAALDRLYSAPMMDKLLGPLYAVLEDELIRMIEEKKEKDKANKSQREPGEEGTIDWTNPY